MDKRKKYVKVRERMNKNENENENELITDNNKKEAIDSS